MEKIRRAKTNAAVRIPAYILMLAALLIAVFSAVAAGINISGGWYTSPLRLWRGAYTQKQPTMPLISYTIIPCFLIRLLKWKRASGHTDR